MFQRCNPPPTRSLWAPQACGHRRCACQVLGNSWQPVARHIAMDFEFQDVWFRSQDVSHYKFIQILSGRSLKRNLVWEVPWPRFLQLLGVVAFVAAPWGHGLDTHRFWEAGFGVKGRNVKTRKLWHRWHQALMMGSVPVVLSSPLDVLYKQFHGADLLKTMRTKLLHRPPTQAARTDINITGQSIAARSYLQMYANMRQKWHLNLSLLQNTTSSECNFVSFLANTPFHISDYLWNNSYSRLSRHWILATRFPVIILQSWQEALAELKF